MAYSKTASCPQGVDLLADQHKALTRMSPSSPPVTAASDSPSLSSSRRVVLRLQRGPIITDGDCETQRIRERFLHRLGISAPAASVSLSSLSPSGPMIKPSRSTNSFHQALKDDDATTTTTSTTTDDSSLLSRSLLQVHFDPDVVVYEIPSRHQYSSRIAQELWTPMEEFQQNICRNSVEFRAERYDWKQVVGDEDMIVIGTERIHPIHFGIIVSNEYRDDDKEKEPAEEAT